MDDPFEQQEWLRLGVAAVLARQYAADQVRLIDSLARLLEEVLPGETRVERRGGLFSARRVVRLQVELGEHRYLLETAGQGGPQTHRARVVRGIALKTEVLPMDDWLAALGAAVDERTHTHEEARAALRAFVP